jgi:hypothetical protein
MDEKYLICKIKELRKIKPSKDWVVCTKVRILGEVPDAEPKFISILEFFPRLVYRHNRLAFAGLIVFAFLAGTFTFAQNSLPGDPIFVFKKITEKSREILASEQDLPKVQLEFANKRLEELNEIAKTNQIKKLAPAIQEFQANISRAAENLVKTQNPNVKQIAFEARKLKENKEKIEALGIVVGETKDFDNAMAALVERELSDLGERTLNAEQKEILDGAKEDFADENYSDALEKILLLSYPGQ